MAPKNKVKVEEQQGALQPAKKAKAKAKATGASSAQTAEAAVAAALTATGLATTPEAMKCNGEILSKHMENVRVFRENAVSEDIVQMKPDPNGFLQPFDPTQAITALRKEARYMCCINLMWVDQSFSASPHVPTNRGAIEKLKQHYFKTPSGLEQQSVTIGILQAELDAGTFPAYGCWRRLSPEESVMAWFQAAAESAALVRDGATDQEPVLQEWLRHCLSTACIIKVVENQAELDWVAAQLREDMAQLTVLQRTPVQRIFDLCAKRDLMGSTYTPEALVTMYDKKLKFSSTSERMTLGS